jgi:N-hydroxyarylamine O-acetyltransferase
MDPHSDDADLDPALRTRVVARLGLAGPPALDEAGLAAFYAAWCASVPFDNVRKMIALRTRPDGPLPGGDATDFFEHWLSHGVGGTCWPTSNALFALARSLGFRARRVAGSMRDLGIVNHGSVKVAVDGREWLVDSSSLTNVPLPLGDGLFVHDDGMLAVEVEPTDGTHVVWTHTPPNSSYLPCRLLIDPASSHDYAAGYEASRVQSPFNRRLYARRNRSNALIVLAGRTRFAKTAAGLAARDLSTDELCQALRDDIGLSPGLIDDWVRCGGLGASFEPSAGPTPPRAAGKPPSQRGDGLPRASGGDGDESGRRWHTGATRVPRRS